MRSPRLVFLLVVSGFVAIACAGEQGSHMAPPPENASAVWLASWHGEAPPVAALNSLFRPPSGFERDEVQAGSFGAWLLSLPVRLDRDTVQSYRGTAVNAPAAAVFALDLGGGDLQQCADTIIRLHAEYLWASGQQAEAAYHFTSGDLSAWRDWVRGERFAVSGSRVGREMGPPRGADYASYRSWLQHLFLYAGTMSMRYDSEPVESIRAGDFFVVPGSPGHTVIVLDVAADERGSRVALIGQGYTPAQDFHLLGAHWPGVLDGVWFPLPASAEDDLRVPGWRPFPKNSARRFLREAQP